MNFEVWFCIAVLITGICYFINKMCVISNFSLSGVAATLIQSLASVFLMLFSLLLLRSFVVEPFLIPSGSEKPNLLVGDFILVTKFSYGLRLPVSGAPLFGVTPPKRGDTVVFRLPSDPSVYFVKRLIGLPGDKIQYKDKQLIINGEIAAQTYIKTEQDTQDHTLTAKEGSVLFLPFLWIKHCFTESESIDEKKTWPVFWQEEDLLGYKHPIYLKSEEKHVSVDIQEWRVPAGYYFVLGDNRDNSYDSRHWGFVSEHYVVGKAKRIFFSLDYEKYRIRWKRIGMKIV